MAKVPLFHKRKKENLLKIFLYLYLLLPTLSLSAHTRNTTVTGPQHVQLFCINNRIGNLAVAHKIHNKLCKSRQDSQVFSSHSHLTFSLLFVCALWAAEFHESHIF